MNPESRRLAVDANEEIAALAAALHRDRQRLAELTGGQTEAVVDRSGTASLHQRALDKSPFDESGTQSAVLFDANPLPMWVYDLETLAFLAVNEAAVEHYGYSREQFLTMSVADIRPDDDAAAFRKSLQDESAGMQHSGLWRHRNRQGAIINVEVTSHSLNFLGRRARLVLANDVTERNRSERALHQALIRLNEAQRIGQIGDWEWTFATKAFTWSPQVFAILGRDPRLGPPRDRTENAAMFDAPSAALMEEKIALAIKSGEPQECDLLARRPDGEQVHVHAVAVPEKDKGGCVFRMHGTIQDISAQTRLTAAIRESGRRYHSLFDNMLEGYACCQTLFDGDQLLDFTYVEVNRAFQTLTGLKDVVGKKVSDVIPGIRESQRDLFQIYGRVALTGEPKKFEVYLETLGKWLSITAYSNDREHFVAVFEDVSARRLVQQALQASEAEQRHIAQQLRAERSLLLTAQRIAKIGNWETDLATSAVTWSAETHRIFETDPDTFAVTHQKFLDLVHPEDRARVADAFTRSLAMHTPCMIQHRVLLPSARIKHVEERWQVGLDERGKATRVVGTCQDVTEHKWAGLLVRRSSGKGSVRQATRVLVELGILAIATMLIYALAARFDWYEAIAHRFLTTGQLDEAIVAAVFLSVALVVFAFRRLRESQSSLLGQQRVQDALILLHDDLDRQVEQRTDELAKANQALGAEITDRKNTQADLREANSQFRQLAEHIGKVIFLTNSDNSKVLYVNPAYEALWGRSCASLYADASSWSEAIHPDDRARILASDQESERAIGFDNEYRIVRADGSVRWVHALGFPVRNEVGEIYRIAATAEDITERKRAQLRIKRLNRVYALLSEINNLIVHVHDQDELFSAACKIAIEAGGFRMSFIGIIEPGTSKVTVAASAGKDEALLIAVKDALSSSDLAPSTMVMKAIREKKAMAANNSLKDPRLLLGDKYSKAGVRSLALLPLLVAGEAVGIFVLYASVPEFFHEEEMKLLSELAGNIAFAIDHIRKGEKLNYLAYYDALTGLSNRTLFLDRVAQSLRRSAIAGTKLSMVLLDLERFKQVNDKLGLSAGDALLVWVAERLTRALGDAALLARVGTDEFALVIPEEQREGDVARILEKTSRALREDPLSFDGTLIRVAASFGVAQYPEDGVDAQMLFKNAEIALKLAKSSSEPIAYFSSEMNARNTQRLELEEQLRTAIQAQQFVLHYQPKMDMISGALVGAEALIRWQHPRRGLLGPTEFIGLAEETGLIVPIGSWVIDAVCAQQAAWIAAGLVPVPIAVNVAAAQFEKDDLLQTVHTALTAHSLEARLLDLELTESAVMNNSAVAATTLKALRKIGVGLALDDFGTGFSSLAHLKRFPFNAVKIDRSFVIDITHNAEDAAIAVAIIAMAHSLKLKVVAEGIETQGQFNYLCARGCDQMQGNLFSAAVNSEAFESDLRSVRRMSLPEPAPADVRTLLLVDDEPHICAALARMLRPDGYRILTANSGLEGLDVLSVNAVQVIISDQRMPGMSGTEFLNTVRQLYPETLRIILSGYTDLAVVTEAVNRGAVFKFLTKPWDDEVLRETVRDAFRRYRPESDIARHMP